MNFQAELNNGGMHQYLSNSSGDFARETPEVFRRMGADEAARILEQANAFFGPSGPSTDREVRMACYWLFPKMQRIGFMRCRANHRAEDRGLSLADLFDAYVLLQRQGGG